jgi:hypothetical protein
MRAGCRGKREREAGKRHRRGIVYHKACNTLEWITLKHGHKHSARHLRRTLMADPEKRCKVRRNEIPPKLPCP